MCEPSVIDGGGPGHFTGTHLSVAEHQARTVANFLELRDQWPEVSDHPEPPFMPVLQGWDVDDYWRCTDDLYDQAGVRLEDYPVVGLGSVCRRQGTAEITRLVDGLTPWVALHGFGMKTLGLRAVGDLLTSAESLAWSYEARRNAPMPGHSHQNCANCLPYAIRWRDRLLARTATANPRWRQDDLFGRRAA